MDNPNKQNSELGTVERENKVGGMVVGKDSIAICYSCCSKFPQV
jgi:hypothetical protein